MTTPEAPDGAVLLAQLINRPPWHAHAACSGADPAPFFPLRGDGRPVAALAYCEGCSVRSECLSATLDLPSTGLCGGTTGMERRVLRPGWPAQRGQRGRCTNWPAAPRISSTSMRSRQGRIRDIQGRFAPEQIAANPDLAIAVAAREAELELLTLAYNTSKQVKPQQYLGAARDIVSSADLLVEQYKYSHRIPDSARFTAVFPSWVKGLIRSDIVREVAHSNNADMNVWALTDEQIEAWFAVRNIGVIWTIDGLKAQTIGTGSSGRRGAAVAEPVERRHRPGRPAALPRGQLPVLGWGASGPRSSS